MPEITPDQLTTLHNLRGRLLPIGNTLSQLGGEMQEVLEQLSAPLPAPPQLPYIDRVREMPVNENPDHPYFIERRWFMWPSRTGDPTGITIHHTMSHSPEATAAYCTKPASQGGKGYPTTQYHFWVSAGDGCPVWRLVPVDLQVWHDHTGAFPKTISVGLAGALHVTQPPQEQLEAAGALVRWLMAEYDIPLREVVGHCDRYSGTVCPGWNKAGWRDAFYEAVKG